MFCDEPIVRVYLGRRGYDDLDGTASFLDCYGDLAYHVTEGHRLVLETKSWSITLDVDGVSKEAKSSFSARPDEWLQDGIELMYPDDTPYIHFESTLFVGEYLLEVVKEDDQFLCRFEHFTLKVIPYELGTMDLKLYGGSLRGYLRMLGFDRHLTRKCTCGGDGEILMDWLDDYVVRCKNCKKSTWANMELQSAINDWNNSELNCVVDDITIE